MVATRIIHNHAGTVLAGPISTGLFALALFLSAGTVLACGWWGDGELNRDATLSAAEEEHPALRDARIANGDGYGLAIDKDGRAEPYRRTIAEGRGETIEELARAGFAAVIDLDSPEAASSLHRPETEAARMRYFSLTIGDGLPTPEQVHGFSRVISNPQNRPLLVFGHSPDLAAIMWTIHTMNRGADPWRAFAVGRALGLSRQAESDLAWHLRNGRLSEFGATMRK